MQRHSFPPRSTVLRLALPALAWLLSAPAASAQFVDGDLYVSSYPYQILRVDPATWKVTTFAGYNEGVDYTTSLVFTTRGTLLSASQIAHQILELDSAANGSILYDATDGLDGPGGPNGLVHDPANGLYISNNGAIFGPRVLRFAANGTPPTVMADQGDGLTSAGALAFARNGDLLIANGYDILKVDPAGNASVLDTLPAFVHSILVRHDGDLYAGCSGGDIYRYPGGDPAKRVLFAQIPGSSAVVSMIFRPDHRVLYYTSLSGMNLVTVDPDTGAYVEVIPTGGLPSPTGMAVFGAGCGPSIRQYGIGVVGTGGFRPTLDARGNAAPGGSLTLEIRDFIGQARAFLLVGAAPDTLPALGGTLYVSIFQPNTAFRVRLPGTPGGAGEGDLDLSGALPPDPALSCLHLYFQLLALDPAAPRRVTMTNGLDLFLGK